MSLQEYYDDIMECVAASTDREDLYHRLIKVISDNKLMAHFKHVSVTDYPPLPLGRNGYRTIYGRSKPECGGGYTTIWLAARPEKLPAEFWEAIAEVPFDSRPTGELIVGWPDDPFGD